MRGSKPRCAYVISLPLSRSSSCLKAQGSRALTYRYDSNRTTVLPRAGVVPAGG